MKNVNNNMVKLFLILPLNGTAGAVTRLNQDVTCYVANPTTEFPSRPGYKYVLGTTGASQLSVRGNYGSPPKNPYGTRVTFKQIMIVVKGSGLQWGMRVQVRPRRRAQWNKGYGNCHNAR